MCCSSGSGATARNGIQRSKTDMQMAKVFGLMTVMTVIFVIAGDFIGGSSMAGGFFVGSMV